MRDYRRLVAGKSDFSRAGISCRVRPIFAKDRPRLEALHERLFPIKYEDEFYAHAAQGSRGLVTWGATLNQSDAGEDLVGFLIACLSRPDNLRAVERDALGIHLSRQDILVHILTFGVDPEYQRCGLGTRLLSEAVAYASRIRARCIYLHVHEINAAAQHIYSRAGFECRLQLLDYYTFRQNKGSSEALNRNALLYVLPLSQSLPNKRDALEMEMRTVSYQSAVGSALLPSSLWRWILKSMSFQLPKGLLSTLFDRRRLTSQPSQRLSMEPRIEQLPV